MSRYAPTGDNVLTIGEFAGLTHLSPKALRLYAKQQLLEPHSVDAATGYRWYCLAQVPRARSIALLRSVGMPLARIRQVLNLPDDDAADAIATFWSEQEQSAAARREVVAFLIDQFAGRNHAMPPIMVREAAARVVLIRTETMTGEDIPAFVHRMFAQLTGADSPLAGPCFLRYRTEISEDESAPIEFCAPIDPSRRDEVERRFPHMTITEEPSAREAVVQIGKSDAYTALGFESLHQWLIANGESSDWTPRQTLLRDPTTADPSDTIYELAITLT